MTGVHAEVCRGVPRCVPGCVGRAGCAGVCEVCAGVCNKVCAGVCRGVRDVMGVPGCSAVCRGMLGCVMHVCTFKWLLVFGVTSCMLLVMICRCMTCHRWIRI